MDFFRTYGLMLFLFVAMAFPIAAGGAEKNDATALRKMLYSIRKATLNALGKYQAPPYADRVKMEQTVTKLLLEPSGAVTEPIRKDLRSIGFEATSVKTSTGAVALIHEKSGAYKGGGLYLLRLPANKSCKVLMAPHGFFDVGTSRISVNAFFGTNAGALLLNSAHRYTGNRDKGVDQYGSDLAHNSENYYFSVFRSIAQSCTDGVFIQIHGFERENYQGDQQARWNIIVSGGRGKKDHLAVAQKAAGILTKYLSGEKIAVYGKQVRGDLGGTTNVHNLYLQGKPNLDFLHIELATDLRKRISADKKLRLNFEKALEALMATGALR